MKNLLNLLLLALVFNIIVGACGNSEQNVEIVEDAAPKYNQFDENGLKTGIWLDTNSHYTYIKSYLNGHRNGIELVLTNPERADILNEALLINYRNDSISDLIVEIRNNQLSLTITGIKPNTNFQPANKLLTYEGYMTSYDENGAIKSRGFLIFGEIFQIDCDEVGIWTYYKRDGTVRTVDYGNGSWAIETDDSN